MRTYYNVLALVGGGKWQPDRDALPWIRFCLNAHYIQAKTMLRRTDEMSKVWTELEAEVDRRGLSKRMIFALADGAFGYRIRNIRYRKVAEVADQTASRDLKKLVDLGILVPQGEARGRFYVASDYIKGLRDKHREKQEIAPPLKIS